MCEHAAATGEDRWSWAKSTSWSLKKKRLLVGSTQCMIMILILARVQDRDVVVITRSITTAKKVYLGFLL